MSKQLPAWSAAAALSSALLGVGTADAQPRDDASDRPLVLEGHLGLGSPYGFLGAAADYHLLRHLALTLGGGVGASGPLGAGMARFRLPFGRFAVSLESGLSVGRHQADDDAGLMAEETIATYVWSPAAWWHTGAGIEGRNGALQWRASLGFATILNDSDFSCTSDLDRCGSDSAPRDLRQVPYVGFALGYAFEL